MKQRWLNTTLALLLLGLCVAVTMGFHRENRVLSADQPAMQPVTLHAAAEAGAAQLAGDYSGGIDLQFTLAGVYSDTLATPPPPAAGTPEPPDLGTIDLALKLNQSGSALSGYVSLDKTLVFTAEHTIQNGSTTLKTGPNLSGSFDGTNLTVLSERVTTMLSGEPIQRQFRLTGAATVADGSVISGEYRETLWGAARAPITLLGRFTLQRTVFPTDAPDTTNKAPDTVADSATTTRGATVTVNVLANDSDVNGDALTVTGVSKPQFGTATTDGQRVTYTPNAGFAGEDSFSYFVSDGNGNRTAGSVTVTVNGPGGPNQPPTAANDSVSTGVAVAVLIDVLGNDADANGDTLSISID
ncbi:MAG: cadherin-like domain-containing protein, partial [Caldilineaceae bacterium]